MSEVKYLNRNNPKFSELEAKEMALGLYGVTGEFEPLDSERDQNFLIDNGKGEKVVLKISNIHEDEGVIDFQVRTLMHIEEQNPALKVPRVILNKTGEAISFYIASNGDQYIVHMLGFLSGCLMSGAVINASTWRNLGGVLAQVDKALSNFFHPHAGQKIVWDMKLCGGLKEHTHYISDTESRKNIEAIFQRMEDVVLPQAKLLRHQVIHGDAHNDNVLCVSTSSDEVTGLIDFGDMHYATLPAEIAVAADFELVDSDKYIETLCELTAGYDAVFPLEEKEIDLIYDLLLCRYAMVATVIAWRNNAVEDEPAYFPDTPSLKILSKLLEESRVEVTAKLRLACGYSSYSKSMCDEGVSLSENLDDLMPRRNKVLGKHLQHFYDQPLHIERGVGAFLYDTSGKSYLDCYNNVPVIGHCHPHLVKSVSRQLATLNTNTRYIYENIIRYSERLVSTLPDHLSACLFVNSGSEANDVAWQIAEFTSEQRGAIVMENAYHGITKTSDDLSPYDMKEVKDYVATLVSPDTYRGQYRTGETDLADKYAADVDRCIAELATKEYGTAGLMIDSTLMSNGIPDAPQGYIEKVANKVRQQGGLIIADEVQSGFGRMGEMWGFNVQGFRPDIVTLGKPVGNGVPLGVVVTTPEILDAFTQATGLFSTFGGNPVACSAGIAVLDVIERDNLIEQANDTGSYLREGLNRLKEKYSVIGDVRGCGLLAAVELVEDRESLKPAREKTLRLIELMRDNGVLVGKEGPLGNVIKIRPPLVMQREHVDLFIEAMGNSLKAL